MIRFSIDLDGDKLNLEIQILQQANGRRRGCQYTKGTHNDHERMVCILRRYEKKALAERYKSGIFTYEA